MAEKVEIKLNRSGVRSLLRSKDVEQDLLRRAQRVAEAARARAPEHIEIVADSSIGANRARAVVVALGGYDEELDKRFLSSAIDAAG